MNESDELEEKVPTQTQSMQIPIPLKREMDELKICKDETYPSLIRRLVDNYKNSKIVITRKR